MTCSPPHRTVREDFPHTAPQGHSHIRQPLFQSSPPSLSVLAGHRLRGPGGPVYSSPTNAYPCDPLRRCPQHHYGFPLSLSYYGVIRLPMPLRPSSWVFPLVPAYHLLAENIGPPGFPYILYVQHAVACNPDEPALASPSPAQRCVAFNRRGSPGTRHPHISGPFHLHPCG